MTNSKKEHVKMTSIKPPSCDLPPEFYQTKLKPCPFCGSGRIDKGHGSIFCLCCGSWLFTADSHVHKWNSIPRRSEVVELIRLVDWLKHSQSESEEFPKAIHAIYGYADKLRKEIGE
jgi:ribosomal protein L24E